MSSVTTTAKHSICLLWFFFFWLFVSRSIFSLWGIYVVFSPPPLFFEPPFFVFVCHIETGMSMIFIFSLGTFFLVVWNVNLRIVQIKRSNKYGKLMRRSDLFDPVLFSRNVNMHAYNLKIYLYIQCTCNILLVQACFTAWFCTLSKHLYNTLTQLQPVRRY